MTLKLNTCQYEYTVTHKKECPHSPIEDDKDNYCLFHSRNDDKNKDTFWQAIQEKLQNKDFNFEGYYFPLGIEVDFGGTNFRNANFRETTFKDKTTFTNAIFATTELAKLTNFINTKFYGEQGTNFTSAYFIGNGRVDFGEAEFKGKHATFSTTKFSAKAGTYFNAAKFLGNCVPHFNGAEFSGNGPAWFAKVRFEGEGRTDFSNAQFLAKGGTSFYEARFLKEGGASFNCAKFSSDCPTNFSKAEFSGNSNIDFTGAEFSGNGDTYFRQTVFSNNGDVCFKLVTFGGEGTVKFNMARFIGSGTTNFEGAKFPTKKGVDFSRTEFSANGGTTFSGTDFSDCHSVHFEGTQFNVNCEFTSTKFPWRPDQLVFFKGAVDPIDLSKCSFIYSNPERLIFRNFKFLQNEPEEFLGCRFNLLRRKIVLRDERRVDNGELEIINIEGPQKAYSYVEAFYRQFKRSLEAEKNWEEAGEYHYGELECKRKAGEHWPFLFLYKVLSGYGERYFWAFSWLLFFVFFLFPIIYMHTGTTIIKLVPHETELGVVNNKISTETNDVSTIKTELNKTKAEPTMKNVSSKDEGKLIKRYDISYDPFDCLSYSMKVATIIRVGSAESPPNPRGRIVAATEGVLAPIIIALFFLALRNKLRR